MKASCLQGKRRILLGIILYFVALALVACAPRIPTQQQVSDAYYGSYPDNYEELIKNFMKNLLYAPDTAVYSDWRGPSKGYIISYGYDKPSFGYKVCVNIDARDKKRFEYTGEIRHFFLIRDGQIIKYEVDDWFGGHLRKQCDM